MYHIHSYDKDGKVVVHSIVTREYHYKYSPLSFNRPMNPMPLRPEEKQYITEHAAIGVGRMVMEEASLYKTRYDVMTNEYIATWKFSVLIPAPYYPSLEEKIITARVEGCRAAIISLGEILDEWKDYGGPCSGIVNYVLGKIKEKLNELR